MSDFEKLINASDLIEWIMETYPDWCEGAVRGIVDHVDNFPSAQPTQSNAVQHVESVESVGDCISRQAAIEAFKRELTTGESNGKYVTTCCAIGYEGIKRILESIPSAQPTQSNAVQHVESVGDCISRQSAINAASYGCGELRGVFERIEERLLALPSAQPERKRGRWTRPSRKNTYERFCSECGDKAWVCGKGDYRFCPNCGAEMRKDGAE